MSARTISHPTRCGPLACVILAFSSLGLSAGKHIAVALPDGFEVRRVTHFDFGPPFDFYEIFVVRTAANGSSIERIILTPAANECTAPAKVEAASALTNGSVAALLGSTNPCAIPEKALRHELNRRKHGLVFSFASVVMQVQCGSRTRLIRADILDRDMFGAAPNTPEHTSWTMELLGKLDRSVGPGVMDKPVFPTADGAEEPLAQADSATLRDISAGRYDALFHDASDKPSDLYRAAQSRPAAPSTRLVSSAPFNPVAFELPQYPPLARLACVEGQVSVQLVIDANGAVTNLIFESGHPLLRKAVSEVVTGWKFAEGASSRQIRATIEFDLNCHLGSEKH